MARRKPDSQSPDDQELHGDIFCYAVFLELPAEREKRIADLEQTNPEVAEKIKTIRDDFYAAISGKPLN